MARVAVSGMEWKGTHHTNKTSKMFLLPPAPFDPNLIFLLSDSDYAAGVISGRKGSKTNSNLIDEARHKLRLWEIATNAVPGHANVKGNDGADKLAKEGRDRAKQGGTQTKFSWEHCNKDTCPCRRHNWSQTPGTIQVLFRESGKTNCRIFLVVRMGSNDVLSLDFVGEYVVSRLPVSERTSCNMLVRRFCRLRELLSFLL